MNDTTSPQPASTLSIAVLILSLAFFVMTAFQTFMLVAARGNLATVRANQEQPIQEANKIRQRAEALAGRIAQLADGGNANAKAIVENFRRQGVDIKPPAK